MGWKSIALLRHSSRACLCGVSHVHGGFPPPKSMLVGRLVTKLPLVVSEGAEEVRKADAQGKMPSQMPQLLLSGYAVVENI